MRIVVRDKNTIKDLERAISITHDAKDGIDYAVVSCSQRPNRETYHPMNKNFVIINKTLNMAIHITTDAMQIWKGMNYTPSLFRVQNAVNILKATLQEITTENVVETLRINHQL